MQPYYDIEEKDQEEKMNPLFSIWIKPKKTFEYLEKLDYVKLCNKLDVTLAFISLSVVLISMLRDIDKTLDLGIGYIIIIGVLSVALGFLFVKYVYSYILLLFSKLFQGKADITKIRIALIYALVPVLIYLIISVGLILVSIFTHSIGILGYFNPITYYVLIIISLRILVIGLAHFNRYSYGYSLMTILIPVGLMQLLLYFIIN